MRYTNAFLSLLAMALLSDAAPADSPPAKISNPFYAMDTAFQRPGCPTISNSTSSASLVLPASPGMRRRRMRRRSLHKSARNAG